MKKQALWAIAASAGLLAVSPAAQARHVKEHRSGAGYYQTQAMPITLEQLPPAVAQEFQRKAKGGQIEDLRSYVGANGQTVYEGEVVKGNKGTEYQFYENGQEISHRSHNEKKEREKGYGQ